MPMKIADYGPGWRALSKQVREDAGWKCEWCGVAHGAAGARGSDGEWYDWPDLDSLNSTVGMTLWPDGYPKIIRIVLTVAHLDHDCANHERANLRALCQRCHLGHDRGQHTESRRRTHARKRAERVALTGQVVMDLTAEVGS